MTPDEIERMVSRVVQRQVAVQTTQTKNREKLEFSKCIMIISTIIFTGTWIVAVVSWFLWRDFPSGLIIFISLGYCLESSAYMGKSAYEYKAKINNTWQGVDVK